MTLTPTVAIVGRPNVGKSTLFNRIVRARRAIVHDQPGVTRDRIVALADLEEGRPVQWVDTGGLVPGLVPGTPEDAGIGINEQVRLALEASDLVLFVVDGQQGPTSPDRRVLDEVRGYRRPIVLVVNKGDIRLAREGAGEFWDLNCGEPVVVSAEHGSGIVELLERIGRELPPVEGEPIATPEAVPVAIVGRPNVGKSSLLNRIVGEERALVSPTPGTTRDPVDTLVVRDGTTFLLIDTAGIRRRAKVSGAPEELAVILARRQIERSDVCVLVIEAPAGVTSGDLAVAGAIWEAGKAAVVAVNKWDLLDDAGRDRLERSWPRLAELLSDPPHLNISAASGRGVEKLFERIVKVRVSYGFELSTGELNRKLEEWMRRHAPPSLDGKLWKLLYATQVSTRPPTFMLFSNRALPVGHSYRRFLENRMREEYDLSGVPVRLVVRRRERRDEAAAR